MKLNSFLTCIFVIITINTELALSCNSDYECWHIRGSQCYEDHPHKTCDCPPNFVMNVEGNECLPYAQRPNDKCHEPSQCILGLFAAECVDHKCQCRKNYHYSHVFKKCIRGKGEGDLCKKEDDSCYQLGPDGKNILQCLNGLCLHIKKLERRPITRVSSVSRVCNADTDCEHIRGSKCAKSGKHRACNCPEEHTMNAKEDECLPIVREVNLDCRDSIQCIAGMFAASCVDNKCKCLNDYHYYPPIEKCIRTRVYGDPCSEEVDGCYQLSSDGDNILECAEDSVCKCKPFYKYVNGTCQGLNKI